LRRNEDLAKGVKVMLEHRLVRAIRMRFEDFSKGPMTPAEFVVAFGRKHDRETWAAIERIVGLCKDGMIRIR